MLDYTLLSKTLQDNFNLFSKDLINNLGMVDKKFIYCMLNGILKSNSCHLSKIGRSLNEDITIDKTIDRLSRNLSNFNNLDILQNNYINYLSSNNIVSDHPLFFVDETDLAKPNAKSFEYLGKVMDGSKEHSWTKGYGITEIVSLYNNEPIIIQSKLWSTADPDFQSKNKYLYDILDENFKLYKNGTYVFDRGFCNTELLRRIIKSNNNFIIRLKQNFKFNINGKKYSIDDIKNNYKGKTTLKTYTNKKTCTINKLSKVKVKLNGIKEDLTLIISYPMNDKFETAYLLTNIDVNNVHKLRQVTRNYFMRWKIEEFFRFKKQDYNFEDIRVRTMNALECINRLINYIITFMSITNRNNSSLSKVIIKVAKPIKENVYFNYYRIRYGISIILNKAIYKTKTYIDNVIRNINYVLKNEKEQPTLFNFDMF